MDEKTRTKAETLKHLRQKIQQMEGVKLDELGDVTLTGIPPLDHAFPNGHFPVSGIHECVATTQEGTAATTGFLAGLLSLLSQKGGAIIWITKNQTVFAPALTSFGIAPRDVIFVHLARDQEILWAMEEALRTPGLSAVVGELADADLTATRRLQLAVEDSHVTGFLFRINPKKTGSSSCIASWRVQAIPSQLQDGIPGMGHPRWEVELIKIRNGTPGKWMLEWKSNAFQLIEPAVVKVIEQQWRRLG